MIGTIPGPISRARELVRPALRRSLGRLSPEIRRVVAYHLGFSDEQGRPCGADGGKAIRPALALLSAGSVGAAAEVALPGAVAVELVHNFSLLHDDVMDQDRERRHRPTAWALFGVGNAITAGDALLSLAHRVLIERPTRARLRAAAALEDATARMIAGQAQDLAFESRLDVSVQECREMSANKTGALLACASSIGAILAGAGDPVVRPLAGFGLHLGLAFQAVDDVLGVWGRPEVTGKPAGSDLRQHKKTLPVAAALASATPASARLRALLQNGRLSEEEVELGVGLVEEAGGRAQAEAEAKRQVALALRCLARAPLEPRARDELVEVAAFVTARDF